MSTVAPFTFEKVELCVVTLNDKPWTRVLMRSAKHQSITKKTVGIIKAFCGRENYTLKHQLNRFPAAGNFKDWLKESRKDDYYISEEEMYELLFSRQQPKAKDFGTHCCDEMFPQVRKKLSDKMVDDLTHEHQQAITGIQTERHLAITYRENLIQTIRHENVGLRGETRAKYQEIAALQRHYMGYLTNEDKNNGITIIAKRNEEAEYPCISICGQHGHRRHEARVMLVRNQGSTLFAEGDTSNVIVTYTFWREYRLIIVDPNRPRNFRLDVINREVVGLEQYVKNVVFMSLVSN